MVRRDGCVRGAELRLHVAADRPVPRVEPLLRDRDGAGRRERGQQGGARREPDGRRDAVPIARRRGDGPDADRHRHGRCVAINVATLFALPVLAVPAIVGGVAVDRGLARAAWLGVAVFVLLVGGGAALLLLDRPIGAVAHTIERIHNMLLRRRPKMTGLGERLTTARDAVRATLGEQWGQAILRSAGNVLFDYLALLAALVASGSRPTASLVLLAYVASVVLGIIRSRREGSGSSRRGSPRCWSSGGPRPLRDLGDARLSVGVVLGTDPRRPGRVRAVPTPGSAVAGGGARPG